MYAIIETGGKQLKVEEGQSIFVEKLDVEEGKKVSPDDIKAAADLGAEIAIVVGGGNFWRGRSSGDMDRTRADSIGMLATVMNSLALQQGFLDIGVYCGVLFYGFVSNHNVSPVNQKITDIEVPLPGSLSILSSPLHIISTLFLVFAIPTELLSFFCSFAPTIFLC